jgi:hypothetical protein
MLVVKTKSLKIFSKITTGAAAPTITSVINADVAKTTTAKI